MNTFETILTIIALVVVLITFINLRKDALKHEKEISKLDKQFERVMKKLSA